MQEQGTKGIGGVLGEVWPPAAEGQAANVEVMRKFETGATRDLDKDKLDYEGFFDPEVMDAFARYMHKNRLQKDGTLRASDNWKKGIPKDAYMKSGFRHFVDWWREHRGLTSREGIIDALCGLMFNTMGYLFEVLRERENKIEPGMKWNPKGQY